MQKTGPTTKKLSFSHAFCPHLRATQLNNSTTSTWNLLQGALELNHLKIVACHKPGYYHRDVVPHGDSPKCLPGFGMIPMVSARPFGGEEVRTEVPIVLRMFGLNGDDMIFWSHIVFAERHEFNKNFQIKIVFSLFCSTDPFSMVFSSFMLSGVQLFQKKNPTRNYSTWHIGGKFRTYR